jgi:hypothetical protein
LKSDPVDIVPPCGVWVKRLVFLSCFNGGSGPEPEAVITGFEDVAVVGEPIEKRGCHLGIAKHPRPFAEAEVGGDDDASLLVKLTEQMEQQCASGLAERQVA